MLLLAQIFNQDAPPMAIDGPPFLESIALEAPWGAVAALVFGGIAAFIALNRIGRARRGVAGAAAALMLAAGLAVLASLVTTDRERVADHTRQLVRAVAAGDPAGAGQHLAPSLSVRLLGVATSWGRDEVLARVERDLNGRYRLKDREARVRTLRVGDEPPSSIRSQVRVSVTPESYGLPVESWWLLTWRRQTDGAWRVIEIDIQQIDGVRQGTRID